MRWVFLSLVLLNVFYGAWKLFLEPESQSYDQVSVEQMVFSEELVLLDERGYDVPLAVVSVAAPSGRMCPAVGPVGEPQDRLQILKSLAEQGYVAYESIISVEEPSLSWVYIPAAESRDVAMETLRKLQRMGVDSFVVVSGEDENAISLGYFQSYDSAVGLRERIRAGGFPAAMDAQERKHDEQWLVITPESYQQKGAEAVLLLLAKYPEVKQEHVLCAG